MQLALVAKRVLVTIFTREVTREFTSEECSSAERANLSCQQSHEGRDEEAEGNP
jgi:hypothetical protein